MRKKLDRERAAWAALGSLNEATDQLGDPKISTHSSYSTVLLALFYGTETWDDISVTPEVLRTSHRALK